VARQSFLKMLVAQVRTGTAATSGSYVFDLRGRWRYEPRTRKSRWEQHAMSIAQISAMTRV
jgi:hypothetical protein